MMLNSKAQNKVLTMEEAVLGYPLYPKNLHVQWQGDRNVFTYIDGTALTGENAADGTQTVLLTLDELNRILNADLKGWGQYSWKNARTLVIHREGKRYEIDIEKKAVSQLFPLAKGAQNVTSNGGSLVAYTKGNNLYYMDANGNEFAVTDTKKGSKDMKTHLRVLSALTAASSGRRTESNWRSTARTKAR